MTEPAWSGYCADPFVIRHESGYVMYGTTPEVLHDGLAFQMLVSDDLRTWSPAGGALSPTADSSEWTEHWAPEVAYQGGEYWMYYSAGIGESGHHLRVARARGPLGPFVDCGINLTPTLPFAIDPSPFRDVDGSWWLFFATDDLTGERPGTVVAVARMRDMATIETPQVILRASADWQRYERDRQLYGATFDWHTVEGPHVVHRCGRYWMLYAGGNWQTPGYGVGVATAASPAGPWHLHADGPSLLASDADSGLVGPGHCSVVTAADGSDHLVFHAWDSSATVRRPFVQPLSFGDDGPHLALDENCGTRAAGE